MRLTRKTRIDGHLKKEYDEAKTPYQRVLASTEVTQVTKAKLTTIYASLDPVALRLQIDKLQRQVWQNCRVRSLADATTPA
jgi:hypothetical protein